MRKVQRWRYYCDFCKKAGGAAAAMLKHEGSCTLNPDRHCRLCNLTNGGQAFEMPEALALLPDPTAWHAEWSQELQTDLAEKTEAAMPALRELTQNCPACIMAALRCKKIPVPMVESFKVKEEFKDAMDQANQNRRDDGYY